MKKFTLLFLGFLFFITIEVLGQTFDIVIYWQPNTSSVIKDLTLSNYNTVNTNIAQDFSRVFISLPLTNPTGKTYSDINEVIKNLNNEIVIRQAGLNIKLNDGGAKARRKAKVKGPDGHPLMATNIGELMDSFGRDSSDYNPFFLCDSNRPLLHGFGGHSPINVVVIDGGLKFPINNSFSNITIQEIDLDTAAIDSSDHADMIIGLMGSITYGSGINLHITNIDAFNNGSAYISTLVEAFEATINHQPECVIMPFNIVGGSTEPSIELLNSMFKYYFTNTTIRVITSSGKDGTDFKSLNHAAFPAAIPDPNRQIIAVGSEDCAGNRAEFSNYGYALDVDLPTENLITFIGNNAINTVGGATSWAAPIAGIVNEILLNQGLSQEYSLCMLEKYKFDIPLEEFLLDNPSCGRSRSTSSSKEESLTQEKTKVFPNPFQESIQLSLTVNQPSERLEIVLLSANGQVFHKQERTLDLGNHQIAFQPNLDLNPGMYFIQIQSEYRQPETFKLMRID